MRKWGDPVKCLTPDEAQALLDELAPPHPDLSPEDEVEAVDIFDRVYGIHRYSNDGGCSTDAAGSTRFAIRAVLRHLSARLHQA